MSLWRQTPAPGYTVTSQVPRSAASSAAAMPMHACECVCPACRLITGGVNQASSAECLFTGLRPSCPSSLYWAQPMRYGVWAFVSAPRTPGVCCLFTMTGFALLSCLLPLSTDHYRLRLGSACGLACLCLAAPVCVLSVYKKKGARMGRGLHALVAVWLLCAPPLTLSPGCMN